MIAGSTEGLTVRLGTWSTQKNTLRIACEWCSGRTGGVSPGVLPEVDSRGVCGVIEWMHPSGQPAGRCTNRTPSQPRRPDADFGQIRGFRFPQNWPFLCVRI